MDLCPTRLAVSASKNLFTTQREGAEHVFGHSGRRSLREETCRLARGETPSRRNCTDRRFKDGKAAFPQEWRRGVVKDGETIANVSAPGSVFGEQAALLDQPHTADVRTLEQSEFYVADAQAMLAGDPTVALYVAAILARRLDVANRSLIEVKHQLQAGESLSVIGKTVDKMEEQLCYSGRFATKVPWADLVPMYEPPSEREISGPISTRPLPKR